MPIVVDWDTPARDTIRFDIYGEWSTNDLTRAIRFSDNLIARSNNVIDLILVWYDGTILPPRATRYLTGLLHRRHDQPGMNVFVGTSDTFGTFWRIFTQRAGVFTKDHLFRFVETLEDARLVLEQEREHRTRQV